MLEHYEARILPYSAMQMYELVADVGSYPDFLPWIAKSHVGKTICIENGKKLFHADLVISFKLFRERFTSEVVLDEDLMVIDTKYVTGPMKNMCSQWRFVELDDGCEVNFHVTFSFKSRVLQFGANMFFDEVARRVVGAFEQRAGKMYG
ncbi:MAG: type II toxin-antitoxin system RatA family toxin [Roseovarius sp.]|nr:type II toxin-antitoxin system RatA family toxin [Roseovarius sp.]